MSVRVGVFVPQVSHWVQDGVLVAGCAWCSGGGDVMTSGGDDVRIIAIWAQALRSHGATLLCSMSVTLVDEMSHLPRNIGIIGVGTLGAAIVRGLASSRGLPSRSRLYLSPRGAANAAKLAAEFPDVVCVTGGNQEVVDAVDCVLLAVLPRQADEVLGQLRFRAEQRIVSLTATVKLARIQELVVPVPAEAVAMASCLPSVATREGATVCVPGLANAQAIFEVLGSYTAVDSEAAFARLTCVFSLMGDFYKRQSTVQRWLVAQSIPAEQAARWVSTAFAAIMAGSASASENTFEDLVAEQTAGGMNEMVWKGQEADCAYDALWFSLDSVQHRKLTAEVSDKLAPAAKRARL